MAKKQPSEEPSAEQLHGEALEQGLDQLKAGAKYISILGIAVAIGVIGYGKFKNSTDSKSAEATLDFLSAASVEQLQGVVSNHEESPVASLAQMQLATTQFREGEFETALASYDEFLATYPEHALKEFAAFGRLMALEAIGQIEEAMDGFAAIADDAVLKPQAALGVARCLEQLDRLDDAANAYSEIETAYEDSVWAGQAREFKKIVEQRIRKNG